MTTKTQTAEEQARFKFYGEWSEIEIAHIAAQPLKAGWSFIRGIEHSPETRYRAFQEGWRYRLAAASITELMLLCGEIDTTGRISLDMEAPCIAARQ